LGAAWVANNTGRVATSSIVPLPLVRSTSKEKSRGNVERFSWSGQRSHVDKPRHFSIHFAATAVTWLNQAFFLPSRAKHTTSSMLRDRVDSEASDADRDNGHHSPRQTTTAPAQSTRSPRHGVSPNPKKDSLTSLEFLGAMRASSIVPPLPDGGTMFEYFDYDSEEDVDWTQDDTTKPPFEYVTLIYRAIKASGRERCTLNEIYTYIQDNFLYYRNCDPGWKV
jgi:hypothetical protein